MRRKIRTEHGGYNIAGQIGREPKRNHKKGVLRPRKKQKNGTHIYTEFANIIYVGGGAKVMAAYGRRSNNIDYVVDVRANAKGYEYLAKQIA